MKPKRIAVVQAGEILVGPVVSSDSVFLGAKDDVTVRLDRQTLRPVWEVDSGRFGIGQLVDGGELLTIMGVRGNGVRSTVDGSVLWSAPARRIGIDVWRGLVAVVGAQIELRDPRSGAVVRSLNMYDAPEAHRVCGDLWLAQGGEGADSWLKAVDMESGELAWERELLSEMARHLQVVEAHKALGITRSALPGLFIVAYGASLFACSLEDGSIVWHSPVAVPQWWPNVDDGRIYVLLFDRFIAVDEATGRVLYDMKHPELRRAYRAKAGTAYRGRIAIPNESGHLAVLNLADGALVALHEDKLPLWRTAEADGRLLVTTGDGKLLVFDESIWGL